MDTTEGLPVIGGTYMDRSIAQFTRACQVLIKEEQDRLAPNNALISALCDAVRVARELVLVGNRAMENPITLAEDAARYRFLRQYARKIPHGAEEYPYWVLETSTFPQGATFDVSLDAQRHQRKESHDRL